MLNCNCLGKSISAKVEAKTFFKIWKSSIFILPQWNIIFSPRHILNIRHLHVSKKKNHPGHSISPTEDWQHTMSTFSHWLLLLPLSLPFALVSLGSDKVSSFYASQFPWQILWHLSLWGKQHRSVFLDPFLWQETLINHSAYSSPCPWCCLGNFTGILFLLYWAYGFTEWSWAHSVFLFSTMIWETILKQYWSLWLLVPCWREAICQVMKGCPKPDYLQTLVILKDKWSKVSDSVPFYLPRDWQWGTISWSRTG